MALVAGLEAGLARAQGSLLQRAGLGLGLRVQRLLGLAPEGRGMAVVGQHAVSFAHASWLRLPGLDLLGRAQSRRCRRHCRHPRNHLGALQ